MPASCAVLHCEQKYVHSVNISFHKFPFEIPNVLKAWIAFCERDSNWKPSRWSTICSRHFIENDFRGDAAMRKRLNHLAVPTIQIDNNNNNNSNNRIVNVQSVIVNSNIQSNSFVTDEATAITTAATAAVSIDDIDDDNLNDNNNVIHMDNILAMSIINGDDDGDDDDDDNNNIKNLSKKDQMDHIQIIENIKYEPITTAVVTTTPFISSICSICCECSSTVKDGQQLSYKVIDNNVEIQTYIKKSLPHLKQIALTNDKIVNKICIPCYNLIRKFSLFIDKVNRAQINKINYVCTSLNGDQIEKSTQPQNGGNSNSLINAKVGAKETELNKNIIEKIENVQSIRSTSRIHHKLTVPDRIQDSKQLITHIKQEPIVHVKQELPDSLQQINLKNAIQITATDQSNVADAKLTIISQRNQQYSPSTTFVFCEYCEQFFRSEMILNEHIHSCHGTDEQQQQQQQQLQQPKHQQQLQQHSATAPAHQQQTTNRTIKVDRDEANEIEDDENIDYSEILEITTLNNDECVDLENIDMDESMSTLNNDYNNNSNNNDDDGDLPLRSNEKHILKIENESNQISNIVLMASAVVHDHCYFNGINSHNIKNDENQCIIIGNDHQVKNFEPKDNLNHNNSIPISSDVATEINTEIVDINNEIIQLETDVNLRSINNNNNNNYRNDDDDGDDVDDDEDNVNLIYSNLEMNSNNINNNQIKEIYKCNNVSIGMVSTSCIDGGGGGDVDFIAESDMQRKRNAMENLENNIKNTNPPVECLKCNSYFLNKIDLNIHIKRVHSIQQKHCPICKLEFKTFGDYLKHKHDKHFIKMIKPKQKRDDDHDVVNVVNKQNYHRWRTIKCFDCYKKCAIKEDATKNISFNNGQRRQGFRSQHLSKHIDPFSPIQYNCKWCKKKFKKWILIQQRRKKSPDMNVLSTIETFSSDRQQNNSIVDPMLLMPPPPPKRFTCNLCKRTYKQRSYLNRHIVKHRLPTEWTLKCKQCGLLFDKFYDLQRHRISRDCANILDTFNKNDILISKRINGHFTCTVCGQQYKTKQKLQHHEYVHSGLKLFNCEQCGKEFRCQNNLYQHKITHQTNRNYKCTLCPKEFKRLGGLNQHVSGFHYKIKPHHCPICKYKYALKGDMLRCKHSILKSRDFMR